MDQHPYYGVFLVPAALFSLYLYLLSRGEVRRQRWARQDRGLPARPASIVTRLRRRLRRRALDRAVRSATRDELHDLCVQIPVADSSEDEL